jgi:predicted aldo/keto reductase-like oxidoreductase
MSKRLPMEMERRQLGKTGTSVGIVGLGGEGILNTVGFENNPYVSPYELINQAIDLGINFLDTARAYSGSEAYYGGALKDRRKGIFLASKSKARDKKGALLDLDETLKNLRTDYLDLWQIHDVRTETTIEEIFGPQGALEAFIEAKQKGRVRFVGVTGHHDPSILKKCLEMYDFDTVMLPINPAEPSHGSFVDIVPFACERGVGIIGMKIYLRGLAERMPWYKSMEPFFRFALSQPISTAVIGYGPLHHLAKNVGFAESFAPMSHEEKQKLINDVAPYAQWLTFYKS